jgi:hypothetical protein
MKFFLSALLAAGLLLAQKPAPSNDDVVRALQTVTEQLVNMDAQAPVNRVAEEKDKPKNEAEAKERDAKQTAATVAAAAAIGSALGALRHKEDRGKGAAIGAAAGGALGLLIDLMNQRKPEPEKKPAQSAEEKPAPVN